MRVCSGHVPPKNYRVKPVFDHLIQKFSDSYVFEVQLSIDENLLFFGRAGLGGKCTSQMKDHALAWHHSNFVMQRQNMYRICCGIQGRT
jgi:hypothetical protein